MSDSKGLIGRRVTRPEDRGLTSGAARFCGDISLPGMLDVAFHRTYRPHARLLSVDTAEAAAVESVREVLAGTDIPAVMDLTAPLAPPGRDVYSTPRPLLAREIVRYVGEPVAAAVAPNRYLAEDACERVAAEYEDLPPVVTLEEALAPGAPVLHGPVGSNVLFQHSFDGEHVEPAFEDAHVVIERQFEIPRLAPAPLECRAVLAVPEDDGVRVWYSTQTPYVLRTVLTDALGLPPDQIRISCPAVGGGFGQKSHVYPEDVLIPWLALRYGQPVRWLEDRTENLVASCHARGQIVKVRVAASEDGEVTALDADVSVDVGGYGIYPHGQLLEALGTPVMITGPYRIPSLRFESRAVATNKCPGGGYRGVGLAAAVFVHERVMDIVADQLGLDPAAVRRRNLMAEHELPKANPIGLVYDSGDYPAALDVALEHLGKEEPHVRGNGAGRAARLVGRGLCCYTEYTGMGSNVFQERGMVGITGHEEARVSIEPDGSALVRTSVPSTGQGSSTAFAQIVADQLSLEMDDVEVLAPDTAAGPDGSGSFGSRGTVVGGTAMLKASSILRERLLELAATGLDATADQLELRGGAVERRGDPERRVTFAELRSSAGEGVLDVQERHDPPETTFSYGVHACSVEVDPELGSVEISQYVIVDDCGRMVNPMIVEGQAHGSTAQGIGAALLERVVFDPSGQPLSASFLDYMLPSATDVPDFTVLHLDHRPPESLGGFKGVGEGGTVAGPVAVANAIANALSVELNAIPLTPEAIRTAVGGVAVPA